MVSSLTCEVTAYIAATAVKKKHPSNKKLIIGFLWIQTFSQKSYILLSQGIKQFSVFNLEGAKLSINSRDKMYCVFFMFIHSSDHDMSVPSS